MTTLLNELCTELNAAFDRYDNKHDVRTKLNSVYVPRIKTRINGAISAYRLISDLPSDIKSLETKFWGFLPFVKDPIRDLKEELENILSKGQYQPLNALEAEGVELRTERIALRQENQELRERLGKVEQDIQSQKEHLSALNVSSVSNQDVELSDAQLRSEVEQSVKAEIESLRLQLLEARRGNRELAGQNKRLEFRCESYQKEISQMIVDKDRCEQDLGKAQAEVVMLTKENNRLKRLLEAKKKQSPTYFESYQDNHSNSYSKK
jgi:chromosome segregation ATPase